MNDLTWSLDEYAKSARELRAELLAKLDAWRAEANNLKALEQIARANQAKNAATE